MTSGAKKKRGYWLASVFLIAAAIAVFLVNSDLVIAINGGCLSSNLNSDKFCKYTTLEECCGANTNIDGYAFCTEKFRDDVTSQNDVNALDDCQPISGCCANIAKVSNQCDGYNYRIQCDEDGGTFYEGEQCENDVDECKVGCCIWTKTGEPNQCSYMEYTACIAWDQQSTRPFAQGYAFNRLDQSVSETDCNNAEFCNDLTPATPSGFIHGTVTSQGTPLEGATITTNRLGSGITATSLGDGSYTMNNVPSGWVTLWAYKDGYETEVVGFDMTEGWTRDQNFDLSPLTATLRVTVLGQDSNALIGATVRLTKDGSARIIITDSVGIANFENLAGGRYNLEVSKSGFLTHTEAVDIVVGEAKTVTVNLQEQTCTPDECDLINNLWCNAGVEWVSYDLGESSQKTDYCAKCPSDADCTPMPNCCEFGWLCNGGAGTDTCDAGEYSCSEPCESIPECIIGSAIASPDNIDPDYTELDENNLLCACGSNNYNTVASGSPDIGYCCADGYSRTPCNTRQLEIKVMGTSGNFPTGIDVFSQCKAGQTACNPWDICSYEITSQSPYSTCTFANEFIPAQNMVFEVSADGYQQKDVTINIPDGTGTYIKQIQLDPIEQCQANREIVTSLRVENVIGQAKAKLEWQKTCDAITRYEIRRYKVIGANIDPASVHNLAPVSNNNANTYTIIDEDPLLEWGTVYEYQIRAIYPGNVPSDWYFGNQVADATTDGATRINIGNILCNGRMAADQFCVNNAYGIGSDLVYGVKCQADNQINPIKVRDCSIRGADWRCYLKSDGITDCNQVSDCKAKGGAFGVFHSNESCSDGNLGICYYEYSNTSVDVCRNCNSIRNCYDYLSENACNVDNCQLFLKSLPYDSKCAWYSYPGLEEFGKGLCYKAEYTGTDFCSICNKDSNLPFDNPNCTQDICGRLGSCYSKEDKAKCAECSADTACTNYENEASCIGGIQGLDRLNPKQEFSTDTATHPKSNDSFYYSKDACNLGRCKWLAKNASTNTLGRDICVKDGDADDTPDCNPIKLADGSISWEINCVRDNLAPQTVLTSSGICVGQTKTTNNCINTQNQEWIFTHEAYPRVENDHIATRYCITEGSSDSCDEFPIDDGDKFDATETIRFPENYANVHNIDLDKMPQGFVKLKYYSVDNHNNIEEYNTQEIFVDTIAPTIDITGPIATPHEGSEHTSDLLFAIASSEDVSCTDSLGALIGIDPNKFSNSLVARFSDLKDAMYVYRVECTDGYGNKNNKAITFRLNRLNYILDQLPDDDLTSSEAERLDNIYDANTVQLMLKTGREMTCRYKNSSGDEQSFDDPMEGSDATGDFLRFTKDISVNDGFYSLETYCWKNDPNVKSSTYFTFTVDKSTPETSLSYTDGAGNEEAFDQTKWYLPNEISRIKFICDDKLDFNDLPNEAGCMNAIWCNTTRDDCVPNKISANFQTPIGMFDRSQHICYYSKDNKDHIESTKCVDVKVASLNPGITITSPANEHVQQDSPLTVEGNVVKTDAEIAKVVVKSKNESGDTVEEKNAEISESSFSTDIPLHDGQNRIEATAEDAAGNTNTTYIIVYVDKIGPVLEINATNSSKARLFLPTSNFAEWGATINFTASANDFRHTRNRDEENNVEIEITFPDESTRTIQMHKISENSFNHTFSFTRNVSGTFDEPVGSWTIRATAKDRFNNEAYLEKTIEVKDTIRPKFSIAIEDSSGIKATAIVPGKQYKLIITSSEPLSAVPIVNIKATRAPFGEFIALTIDNLDDVSDGRMYIYSKNFTINDFRLIGFDTDADFRFEISGTDTHDNLGTSTIPFAFRGAGQPAPTYRYPATATHFTRADTFPVTGYEAGRESGIDISLAISTTTDDTLDPANWNNFSTIKSAGANPQARVSAISDKTSIGNVIVVSGYDAIFSRDFAAVPLYVKFEEATGERYNTQTGEYYKIKSATAIFPVIGPTKLELDRDVTNAPVPVGTIVGFYEENVGQGFFRFDLTGLSQGNNFIVLTAQDEYGNWYWDQLSSVKNIIYDSNAPLFIESPANGTTTTNNRTTFNATISDVSSGITGQSNIDTSSIRLFVNEVEKTCIKGIGHGCKFICDAANSTCNLTYSEPAEFPKGIYDLKVIASDNLGSVGEFAWTIIIDPDAAEYPSYKINTNFEDEWKTSSVRNVLYTDNTTTNIFARFVQNVTASATLTRDAASINLQQSGTTPGDLTFNPVNDLGNGEHVFTLSAQKYLADGSLSSPISDEIRIIVDTDPPTGRLISVTDASTGLAPERGKPIKITIETGDATPNASVSILIDGMSVATQKLSGLSAMRIVEFIITPTYDNISNTYDLDYGNHDLQIVLTDYFSKSTTIYATFFVADTTPPRILGFTEITPGTILSETEAKTKSQTPTLTFVTDEPASCDLTSPIPALTINSDYTISHDFTIAGNLYYPTETGKDYEFTCMDERANSGATTFRITLDQKSPVITSIEPTDGSTIDTVDASNNIAPLRITADEAADCRFYGNLSSNAIPLPTDQHERENFYYSEMSSFETVQNSRIFTDDDAIENLAYYPTPNVDKSRWKFTFGCKDPAGNFVFDSSEFTLDLEILVIVQATLGGQPSGSTVGGSSTQTLYAKTDKSAVCRYNGLDFANTGTSEHSTTINGLMHESSVTYVVTCKSENPPRSAEKTVTYGIDLDVVPDPELESMEDELANQISSGNTVNPSRLTFNGSGESSSLVILYDDIGGTLNPWPSVNASTGTAGSFELEHDVSSYDDGILGFLVRIIDLYTNSEFSNTLSLVIDRTGPRKPVMFKLKLADVNNTYWNSNEINVYGYSYETGLDVGVYDKFDNLLGQSISEDGSFSCVLLNSRATGPRDSSEVTVGYASEFDAGDFIEFENHNRSSALRYKVSSVTEYAGEDEGTLQLDPSLEAQVSTSKIRKCSHEKPAGWFNITATLPNGNSTLRVVSTDFAGRKNSSQLRQSVFVDTTAPVISVILPADGEILAENRTNITVILRDTESGISLTGTSIEIEGTRFEYPQSMIYNHTSGLLKFALPATEESFTEGPHTIAFETKNNAGVMGTASSTFTINKNVPSGRPKLTVNSHEYGDVASSLAIGASSLGMQFDYADGETINVSWFEFSGTQIPFSKADDNTFTASHTAADGLHNLRIAARKLISGTYFGPQKISSYTLIVDTIPPLIAWTNRIAVLELGSDLFIRANVSDNLSSVDLVKVSIEGSALEDMEYEKGNLFNHTFRNIGAGAHNLTILAQDALGNGREETWTFNVADTKAPAVRFTYPGKGDAIGEIDMQLVADIRDYSGISDIKMYVKPRTSASYNEVPQDEFNYDSFSNELRYTPVNGWIRRWSTNTRLEADSFDVRIDATDTNGLVMRNETFFTIDTRVVPIREAHLTEVSTAPGAITDRSYDIIAGTTHASIYMPDIRLEFEDDVSLISVELSNGSAIPLDILGVDGVRVFIARVRTSSTDEVLAEGRYILRVTAEGLSNQVRSRTTYDIIIDRTVPQFEIDHQDVGKAGQFNVSVSARDEEEVFRVNPSVKIIDSTGRLYSAIFVSSSSGTYMYSADLSAASAGTARVNVSAQDMAGNFNFDDSSVFAIDKKAPFITLENPMAEVNNILIAYTNQPMENISLRTDEVSTCTMEISGVPYALTTIDGLIHLAQSEIATNGRREIVGICSDIAGNQNTTLFAVEYDDRPPLITSLQTAKPSPVIDFPGNDLIVTADEPVICRYSLASSDYASMEKFFPGHGIRNFSRRISTNAEHNEDLHALTDGLEYNYYVSCEDRAGNFAPHANISFLVRIEPGLLFANVEPKGIVPASQADLEFNTNHPSTCRYRKAGEPVLIIMANTGGLLHRQRVNLTSDGPYQFDATCTYASYINSTDIDFIADLSPPTAPTILSDTHYLNNSWNNLRDANFTLSATPDIAAFSKYKYSMASGANCDTSTYIDSYNGSIRIDGLSDGAYAFCAKSVDEFDRQGELAKYLLKIDTAKPISSDNADLNWHKNDVIVTIMSSDAESGIYNLYYTLNDAAEVIVGTIDLPARVQVTNSGINNISYFAIDNAGNAEPMHLQTALVDKVIPRIIEVVSPTHVQNSITNNNVFGARWQGIDEHSGISHYEYLLVTPSGNVTRTDYAGSDKTFTLSNGEGDYIFHVRAVDNAGNKGEYSPGFRVTLDTTDPVPIFVQNIAPYLNNPQLPIKGISRGADTIKAVVSGTSVYGSYDGTFASSETPQRTRTFADAKITNTSIIVEGSFEADTHKHLEFLGHQGEYRIITASADSGYTTMHIEPGLLTNVDEGSELNVYTTRVAGAFDIDAELREGQNRIKIISSDAAGNKAEKSVATALDTNAPVIDIDPDFSNIGDGDVRNGKEIKLKFVYSDIGLSGMDPRTIRLEHDGNPVLPATVGASPPHYATYSASNLAVGEHTIGTFASDAAGNAARRSLRFTIDNTLPSLQIEISNANFLNTPDIRPNITLIFNESVRLESANLNGTTVPRLAIISSTQGKRYVLTPEADLSQRHYRFKVNATDARGGTLIGSAEFIVDATLPSVSILSRSIRTASLPVQVNLSYSEPNLDRVELRANGILQATYESSGNYPLIMADVQLASGTNNVSIDARDKAGNHAHDEISAILDIAGPSVPTITVPSDGFVTRILEIQVMGLADAETSAVVIHAGPRTYNAELAGVTYRKNIRIESNEITEVYAVAYDALGNSARSSSIFVKHDDTAPIVAPVYPVSTMINILDPTIVADVSDLPTERASGLSSGSQKIVIDGVAYSESDGVQYIGDSTSGKIIFHFTPGVTGRSEHVVTASMSDTAGMVGNATWRYVFDPDAAMLAVFEPAEGSYITQTKPQIRVTFDKPVQDVRISVEDASGRHDFELFDNLLNRSFTFNDVTVDLSGYVEVDIVTTDFANNSAYYHRSFTVDTAEPVISLERIFVTNRSSIRVRGSYTEENIEKIELVLPQERSIGLSPGHADAGEFEFIDVPLAANLPNAIKVKITDKAGRHAFSNYTVLQDSTAPSLSISTPRISNSWQIPIAGTTDGVRADLLVDGTYAKSLFISSSAFADTADVSADGWHELQVKSYDHAGNSIDRTAYVAVDSVPAHVEMINPADRDIRRSVNRVYAYLEDNTGGSGINLSGSVISVAKDGQTVEGTVLNEAGDLKIFTPNALLSDGSYSATVHTKDNAGNVGEPITTTFTIDQTSPLITISSPASLTYTNSRQITVSGRIEAATGRTITGSSIIIDGRTMPLTITAEGEFSIGIDLSEGRNEITVISEDNEGTHARESIAAILDTNLPTISITAREIYISDPAYVIEGAFSDANLDADAIKVTSLQSGSTVTAQQAGNSFRAAVNLQSSINNFTATITDKAGNSASAYVAVILDNSVPVINLAFPPALTYFTIDMSIDLIGNVSSLNPQGATISVNLNGNDITSAVADAHGRFRIDNMPIVEGNNSVIITATTSAGKSSRLRLSVIRDTQGPGIRIRAPPTYPDGSYNAYTSLVHSIPFSLQTNEASACTLRRLASQTEIGGSTSDGYVHSLLYPYAVNYSSAAVLITNFNLTCKDSLQNPSQRVMSLHVDTTPPVITDAQASPNPVTSLSEPTDPLTLLTVTTNELTRCRYIQNTTPGIQPLRDIRRRVDAFNSQYARKFSDEDRFEVVHARALLESDFALAENTLHGFYVICMNIAGNVSEARKVDVDVSINWPLLIRTSGPSGMTNRKNVTLYATTNMNATCTATRSGDIIPFWLRRFLGFSSSLSGVYNHSVGLSLTEDSDYEYSLVCEAANDPSKDPAGASIRFTLKTQVAAPVITSPANDYRTDSSQIVVIGTTERGTAVFASINGGSLEQLPVDGTSFTATLELARPGTNTLTITAVDGAGNRNSASTDIIYSTIGPGIIQVSPQENSKAGAYLQNIEAVLISDLGIGLDLARSDITLADSAGRIIASGASDNGADRLTLALESNLHPLTSGPHTVTVTAFDLLGRWTSYGYTFTVDSSLPSITFTTPPYPGTAVNRFPYRITGLINATSRINYAILEMSNQLDPINILNVSNNGSMRFSLPVNLTEGSNEIKVTSRSELGIGDAIAMSRVILDTSGPSAVAVTVD